MSRDTFKEIISELDQVIEKQQSSLSSSAQNSLKQDLLRVLARLEKSEYQIHDFSGDTFDVARRTSEFFYYFNSYVLQAKVWESAFRALNMTPQGTVVDIGPGNSPRIAIALKKLGFSGEYVPFDNSTERLLVLIDFLKEFNLGYQLRPLVGDFLRGVPLVADLLVANHLIDDLLFDYLSGQQAAKPYASEAGIKQAWQQVWANQEKIPNFVQSVVERFNLSVGTKQKQIIISQYPSYLERLLNLDREVDLTNEILLAIKIGLIQSGYECQQFEYHGALRAEEPVGQQEFLLFTKKQFDSE